VPNYLGIFQESFLVGELEGAFRCLEAVDCSNIDFIEQNGARMAI
jgi:hypothetical protein